MTKDGALAGRSALITGASQGLGFEIARSFLAAGADIVICARDADKLEESRIALASGCSGDRRILARPADVSVEAEANRLAQEACEAFPGLQILVNNAGVYGPMGPIEDVDWAAWMKALEVNLLGSVHMCRALVPQFKKRRYGKIIQISGGGATNPLPNLSAYAASKAAVVRFAETLAEELRPFRVDVNAVAPGALNTRMLDEVLAAGAAVVGRAFYDRSKRQQADGGTPLEKGAALCAFLASAQSDGITGKLLSAVWDPWDELPGRRSELDGTDVYTLRRIVPKDRGLSWGDR
jgi:NAD(P)-dependent dehydrogenase (short-subunit alcohol dehydrogenase family)